MLVGGVRAMGKRCLACAVKPSIDACTACPTGRAPDHPIQVEMHADRLGPAPPALLAASDRSLATLLSMLALR